RPRPPNVNFVRIQILADWWSRQSDANPSPLQNPSTAESLLTGKRTGNFTKQGPPNDFGARLHEGFQSRRTKIPYSAEQGIWISITGILFDTAGNFSASVEVNPGGGLVGRQTARPCPCRQQNRRECRLGFLSARSLRSIASGAMPAAVLNLSSRTRVQACR